MSMTYYLLVVTGLLPEIKIFLMKNFEMKDFGKKNFVLDSKPGDTSIVKGDKFSLKQCFNNDLERNEMQKILYASTMGSLMYAQTLIAPLTMAVEFVTYFETSNHRI
ncbi:hypothetical protein CR513_34394, partial [Mucuna pruriens]